MGEPFPWDAVMRFGLGTLGLAPKAFWAMTPRELAAAMAAHGFTADAAHPSRAWLNEQATLHPDRENDRDAVR